MSHVFNINNMSNFNEKINIDELYEKKKNYDLSKLEIFNKGIKLKMAMIGHK